jgi:hypothetical protein
MKEDLKELTRRRRLYKYKILCRKLEREKINKTKREDKQRRSRTKPKRWRIILTAEPATDSESHCYYVLNLSILL